MTRRDRAAMTLALECLRAFRSGKRGRPVLAAAAVAVFRAADVLYRGDDAARALAYAVHDAEEDLTSDATEAGRIHALRLLRVRLALALRVLLRERGDFEREIEESRKDG